jgi:hypothetical protein
VQIAALKLSGLIVEESPELVHGCQCAYMKKSYLDRVRQLRHKVDTDILCTNFSIALIEEVSSALLFLLSFYSGLELQFPAQGWVLKNFLVKIASVLMNPGARWGFTRRAS